MLLFLAHTGIYTDFFFHYDFSYLREFNKHFSLLRDLYVIDFAFFLECHLKNHFYNSGT